MATPETTIKKEIKGWLRLNNWFVFHLLAGLGCYPGAPDLIAVKRGTVLFIEVKTETGILSDNQAQFGIDVGLRQGCYVIARRYEDIKNYLKENNL